MDNLCTPALFLIHEKQLSESHRFSFQEAVKVIPSLKSATCCLVTDKEQAIIKALDLVVPKLAKLLCWNHILRDIEFWLWKSNSSKRNFPLFRWYLSDVNSEEEYSEMLEDYSRTWVLLTRDSSRQGKNMQMGIGAIKCSMQSILCGNKQSVRVLQLSYQGLSIMERSSNGFICVGFVPVTSILWKWDKEGTNRY